MTLSHVSNRPVRRLPTLGTTALGPAGLLPQQAGRQTFSKRQTSLLQDRRPDSAGRRYDVDSPSVTPALGVLCLRRKHSLDTRLSRQRGKHQRAVGYGRWSTWWERLIGKCLPKVPVPPPSTVQPESQHLRVAAEPTGGGGLQTECRPLVMTGAQDLRLHLNERRTVEDARVTLERRRESRRGAEAEDQASSMPARDR